jgi:hypothetical protein
LNFAARPSRTRRFAVATSLLALATFSLAPSAATRVASADALRTPANELLVELDVNASSSVVTSALNTLLWHVVATTRHSETLPTGGTEVLRIAPNGALSATQSAAAALLAIVSGVRTVEHNVAFTVSGDYGAEQSEIPIFVDDLHLASMGPQSALLAAGLAPSDPSGNPGIAVAVLDGGFDLSVEALDGRCTSGYDAIDNDSDPSDAGNDLDDDSDGTADTGVGHGTAIAALIAVAAPEAQIIPIRVLDDEGRGTSFDIANGILAARSRGADVINMSLGAPSYSTIVHNALAAVNNNGILVVASAGNTGGGATFPATDAYVLAVTGVTANGVRAPYASMGTCVDAAAWSVDVIAPFPGMTDGYGTWTGTSFAAAIFSAAAARVLAAHPGDPLGVGADLLEALTAFPSEALPDSTYMGGGILDATDLLED